MALNLHTQYPSRPATDEEAMAIWGLVLPMSAIAEQGCCPERQQAAAVLDYRLGFDGLGTSTDCNGAPCVHAGGAPHGVLPEENALAGATSPIYLVRCEFDGGHPVVGSSFMHLRVLEELRRRNVPYVVLYEGDGRWVVYEVGTA